MFAPALRWCIHRRSDNPNTSVQFVWVMFLLLFVETPVCLCTQHMQSVEPALVLLIHDLTASPGFHMFMLLTCRMCNQKGWSFVEIFGLLQQLNYFQHAQNSICLQLLPSSSCEVGNL